MPTTQSPHSPDELARLGADVLVRRVQPTLRPEDDGKYIAIDVATGEFEVDDDDYTAVTRLRSRLPAADIWLERAGHPTAVRLRPAR